MGEMRVLCSAGDIVVSWNPGDDASTAQAKSEFDRLKSDGYEFFNKAAGKGRRRITDFTPKAGEIIAAPGIASKTDRETQARPKAMRGGPNEQSVMARR